MTLNYVALHYITLPAPCPCRLRLEGQQPRGRQRGHPARLPRVRLLGRQGPHRALQPHAAKRREVERHLAQPEVPQPLQEPRGRQVQPQQTACPPRPRPRGAGAGGEPPPAGSSAARRAARPPGPPAGAAPTRQRAFCQGSSGGSEGSRTFGLARALPLAFALALALALALASGGMSGLACKHVQRL
jgi:hypothetical protein